MENKTILKIQRALRKAAEKFRPDAVPMPVTDLYIQVKPESGELLVFDDDDRELTRCVVEEWIGNNSETFYADVLPVVRAALSDLGNEMRNLPILKPYAFVLVDESKETIEELLSVDDDLICLDGELMKDLDEDLEAFWAKLSGSDFSV